MAFLSEDPSFVIAALVLTTGAFLAALKVTQQAKYLFWALGTLALGGMLAGVEWFWVTDAERIERVVDDLRSAVLASDAEGVLRHLTPDVEYGGNGFYLKGEDTRALIRANLANTTFDFVHVNGLETRAGERTRRGQAEFHVYAKGTLRSALGTFNVGTANSTWSLGFQETEPRVWKVNRITPVSVPEGAIRIPSRNANSAGRAGVQRR